MNALRAAFAVLFLSALARADDPPELTPRARGDLAIKARAVLRKHCYECHGGAASRGTVRVLEHAPLIANGPNPVPFVAPGKVEASQVVQFLEDGSMPPGDRPRPTDDEVKAVKDWIAASAPAYPVEFGEQATLEAVLRDVDRNAKDAAHLRYFSFAHLLRDDQPTPDLRVEEAKLHRALTWCGVTDRKNLPQPVDEAATLYRFDTRVAKWDGRDLFFGAPKSPRDAGSLDLLTPYDLVLLEYPHAFRLAAGHPLAERLNTYVAKQARLARPVPFVRADWLASALAVNSPLADDLKGMTELAAALEKEGWPRLGKEEKMPCGPTTRAFAARNPVAAAAKPEHALPVPPFSSRYSGDVRPDAPPFNLKVEAIDPGGNALKSVKVGDPLSLRVTTDRDFHFVLLMVWSTGEVALQPTNKGGFYKVGDKRPIAPEGAGAFRITSILTGEPQATEYFVLLASTDPIPPPVLVRSRHDKDCDEMKRYPVYRFLFDPDAKLDPARVVRVVVPVTVEK